MVSNFAGARDLLLSFELLPPPSRDVFVSGDRPPISFLKLNVDGSCVEGGHKTSCRGVIWQANPF